MSASDDVPPEGKIQPQDSVFVRRQIHSSATPNLLLGHVIASTSRNLHHNTRTKEKLFLLNDVKMPNFQNCHGTGLSPMARLGVPRGPSEACEGADTSRTGNGEGSPEGISTEWIRKCFIAGKAAWLHSQLPEEVLLEGLQSLAWGCTSCMRTHVG